MKQTASNRSTPTTLDEIFCETALWALWNRSVEAARPGGMFDDTLAVELAMVDDGTPVFLWYFGAGPQYLRQPRCQGDS